MSEFWRIIIDERRGHCSTQGKKGRKLQKEAASTPDFTRERPHWFISTLFLVAHGTVMDSWELTMIHAKLISEISEARLMMEEFCASTRQLSSYFSLCTNTDGWSERLVNGAGVFAFCNTANVRASNGSQLTEQLYPCVLEPTIAKCWKNSKIMQLDFSFSPGCI